MRRARSVAMALLFLAAALSALAGAATTAPPPDLPVIVGPELMAPNPAVYPEPVFVQGPTQVGVTAQTTGAAEMLVLLIEFTDVSASGTSTPSSFETKYNDASSGAKSLKTYYTEVSYGQYDITAVVYPVWLQSSRTMGYYGEDGDGIDDANGPIYRLVVEAVQAADANVDFARFDGDGDGVVDNLLVVHAGEAQETANVPNLIWSHRWAVIDANPTLPGDQQLRADDVQVYQYIMVSEFSQIGVVAHELGHNLGLVDLYDTDGSSEGGVGVWDLMAAGPWLGFPAGSTPSHMSAWSKSQLGWLIPTEVSEAILSADIPAVETEALAFKLPVSDTEYFLVENRQRVGFDAALPGDGLLIYHVDESRANNDNDVRRLVDLEEADERSGEDPSEGSDPWADTLEGFGPSSVPSSNAYGNIRTGWKVRNIGPSQSVMKADISREVADDVVVSQIAVASFVAVGSNVAFEATVQNDGIRDQNAFNVTARVHEGAYGGPLRFENVRTLGGLASGAVTTVAWTFPAAVEGRYVIEVTADLVLDEIPENNVKLASFAATILYFQDDVEAGPGGWTRPVFDPANEHQWRIVEEGEANGDAHSPTRSWRFGYVGADPPNPSPPEFYLLESPPVAVTEDQAYLAFFHRYDLSGRRNTTLILPSDSDTGRVQIRVDGGPWRDVATYRGTAGWSLAYANLTSFVSAGVTLQFRFNVTANAMPRTGGWWLDDLFVLGRPLAGGLALVPLTTERGIEPGGTASYRLLLVNVGDFDDNVTFAVNLPAGWSAQIGLNTTNAGPLASFVAPLAPGDDASLILLVTAPADVLRGTSITTRVDAVSEQGGGIVATVELFTYVNDPLGLGRLGRQFWLFVILFVILVAIAVVIDAFKKQRFGYRP
jgi:M6 family metalloprotease-like protein